ncbi:MAG TPA: protein-L-isoaspartate(D-aspartate) O-methyltransferase [Ignavibacteriaceae bacterium]|nr:protein-L-isoaspartate(D-aspartate) O-methyltransferase [Ignavibacteriaceae bacterium]
MIYKNQRQELVDKISIKGINDIAVLKAVGEVERHKFVPDAMKHFAYDDVALPIGYGQTISQPYTVAFMTQELKLKPGNKVLELGTGSGYQAAILERMGMEVFSIERQYDILLETQKLFDKLGIRVRTKCADGTIGWNEYAPYDGIIVTAGSPSVPPSLKKQLAIGGKLVIPVGDKISQKLKIITKIDEENFNEEDVPEFKFVPLIGREGWKEK